MVHDQAIKSEYYDLEKDLTGASRGRGSMSKQNSELSNYRADGVHVARKRRTIGPIP